MKIIKLNVDNFKRISAVEISPDGKVIMITGRNGEGKTSVLDAIWAALANPRSSEIPKPIKDGEEKAVITLDLEKYIVRRTFTDKGTRLTVTGAEGAEFKSPQKLLDKLIGSLSFDPLEFISMKDKDQVDLLLKLADSTVDFTELDASRKMHYDKRADNNRMVKEIAGMMGVEPKKGEKVDVMGIQSEMHEIERIESEIRVRTNKIKETEILLVQEKKYLSEAEKRLSTHKEYKVVAQSLKDGIDYNESLGDWDAWNKQNENKIMYANKAAEHENLMNEIDDKKKDALEKMKFPYEGLSFGDGLVTYNNIPIKQISKAEQIRVSMAMAMAMNPEIRVIRIEDGSLLDSTNLKLIAELADKHDYQIWIESVDESGEVGIYIEDGMVK